MDANDVDEFRKEVEEHKIAEGFWWELMKENNFILFLMLKMKEKKWIFFEKYKVFKNFCLLFWEYQDPSFAHLSKSWNSACCDGFFLWFSALCYAISYQISLMTLWKLVLLIKKKLNPFL